DHEARPRTERRAVGADFDAHLAVALLDLVVLQHVEVDHHAHHARPELGVAYVLDAATVLPVVQCGGRGEPRALQIEYEPRGARQGEVLHLDRAPEIDHDLHAAGGREHADGFDFAVP